MPQMNKNNSLFFFMFLLLIIGFFCFTELSLRIFHYGSDTKPFIRIGEAFQYLIDNPHFIDKYYPVPTGLVSSKKNLFQAVKPKGLIRGFLIGESTPEGYPYEANQSFGRIVQTSLRYGGIPIEIINLSFSAMSSYYVKDAAEKILDYHPDFIIIYSGHNEYYGTIGALTGGNYFIKNLYLSLKEFRLFQLVMNTITPNKSINGPRMTLMGRLYQNHHVNPDPAQNRIIAENYIKNIDFVIRKYNKKNIPVFLMEPVCNLIDMPPFSGEKDSEFKEFILSYRKVLESKDRYRISEYYTKGTNLQYSTNANIVYLNAKSEHFLNKKLNIKGFIAAKDLDTTPFRARSEIVQELRDKFYRQDSTYSNLFYLPLSDLILKEKGDDAFNNNLFIDHLHFNFEGQCLVAQLLTHQIESVFSPSSSIRMKIDSFYTNINLIKSSVAFNPYNEIYPYWQIESLSQYPPFSMMLNPFQIGDYNVKLKGNFLANLESKEKLMSITGSDSLNRIVEYYKNYYYQKKDPGGFFNYLRSFINNMPSSPFGYFQVGEFLASVSNPPEDPLQYYYTAYYLSDKNKPVFEAMKKYALSHHRENDLRKIEPNYENTK